MRVCVKCGHENAADVDFCEQCGEYLRWEPTRHIAAVPPTPPAEAPPAAPPPADAGAQPPPAAPPSDAPPPPRASAPPVQEPAAPQVRPDSVLITLRHPGDEGSGTDSIATTVPAGGQTSLIALVRNQSGIVDNYDLRLKGFPPEWWTINPSTVYLVPFGAAPTGYEQEVEVRFHPPRAPEAEARPWPIMLAASSRATSVETGSGRASVEIEPFLEIESELRPERAKGRLKANYAVAVRNKGNTPADVALAGADPDSALRFEFDQQEIPIEPGKREGTAFKIRPPNQIFFGRPLDRRFELSARARGTDVAAMPRHGVMVQKPWLPWWILIAIPMIAVAIVALLLLLPDKPVVVPDLAKAPSVFEAEKLLKEAGLELGDVTEEQTADAEPGAILDQTPAAGEEVDKGSTVEIKVAVGTGQAEVPKIVGLTLAKADEKLRAAGFTLGTVRPEPADPETEKIKRQVPKAGTLVQEGTAVNVFFEVPEEEEATTAVADTGADGGGAAVVGVLAGLGAAAAADQLAGAGLNPIRILAFDPEVEKGKIIRTDPEDVESAPKGSDVKLFVSAGFPQVAFDFNGNVFLMGGAAGKPAKALAKSDDVEEQPTWNPSATLIAYRRVSGDGGRIWLVDPTKPQSARPLTSKGFDDRRPAFSPNGKVIAFVRGNADRSDYDLCFIRVDSKKGNPRCIADPEHNVSRPAWAPDGHAILVVSSDPVDAQQVELLEYTSPNPSSGKPPDWISQGLVTDEMHGKQPGDQVVSSAWSPDGEQVAFTANWGSGVVRLFLAPAKDDELDKGKPIEAVTGCEVAWRSDGLELAVTQRDAVCDQPGTIIRVDPADPSKQVVLTKAGASNPAWNPLPPGG